MVRPLLIFYKLHNFGILFAKTEARRAFKQINWIFPSSNDNRGTGEKFKAFFLFFLFIFFPHLIVQADENYMQEEKGESVEA